MTSARDLVVVGASFAGVACGIAAARAGASVRLVERRADPGAKLHTTGIVVKEALAALEALGPVPPALTRPVNGVRLHAPNGKSVALDSPGYFFLATDTPQLMRWLVGLARAAGVEVALGTAFEGAQRTSGGWRCGDGTDSRFLVGADGPSSRVARACGLAVNRDFLFGVEAEIVDAHPLEADRLHCFVDRRLAPGYIGWLFAGVGIVQAGLAVRRHGPAPPVPDLDAFLARAAPLLGAHPGRVVARRAGLIPVGGPLKPRAGNRVLLVGDAAGLVSPLTAGGIHTALDSGLRAGAAIAAAQSHDDDGPLRVDIPAPSFRLKRMLRLAFDRLQSDALTNTLIGNRGFARLARLVFFHRRGVLSAAGWADLLRK